MLHAPNLAGFAALPALWRKPRTSRSGLFLASQDHQTGPPIVTNQLWVPGLFATPRNYEARTADSGCSWSGFAFSGQWANVVSTASCAEATCPPRLPASLCRRCSLVILDGPGAAPFLRICPDQDRNQRLACAPSNLEGTLMRGTGGRRSELVFFFLREREAGNITKECEGQKLRHNQTKKCLMQITPPRRACDANRT